MGQTYLHFYKRGTGHIKGQCVYMQLLRLLAMMSRFMYVLSPICGWGGSGLAIGVVSDLSDSHDITWKVQSLTFANERCTGA